MLGHLRPVLVAALAWGGFLAAGTPVLAQDPAPAVEIAECYIYGNVLADTGDGDMLVLCRADLPIQSATSTPATPEEWCAYLEDTDGCTDDPVEPTNPTSLTPWAAMLAFYDDAGITLRGTERSPRVDHHLVGVYLGIGHGITWGDADATVCVQSSATLFDPPSSACTAPSWRPSATSPGGVAEARSTLEGDIVSVMKNLETVRSEALDTYVSQERITAYGTDFAREAFSLIHVVAPSAFQAGATDLAGEGIDPYETPATGALGAHVAATAEAADFRTTAEGISREWGIGDIELEGRAMVIGVGLVFACIVGTRFRRMELALLAFFTPVLIGTYLFIPMDWIIAVVALGLTAVVILFARLLR